MSIYTELTSEFNRGLLRAILSSGQAVVMHKLAIMSKDGDWILKEEDDVLGHILTVLSSRSARDIIEIADNNPDIVKELVCDRSILAEAFKGREMLERALDDERRQLIRANEKRLQIYMNSSEHWASEWSRIVDATKDLSLQEAHKIIVAEAENVLPLNPLGI